jgi:hypothetical protein
MTSATLRLRPLAAAAWWAGMLERERVAEDGDGIRRASVVGKRGCRRVDLRSRFGTLQTDKSTSRSLVLRRHRSAATLGVNPGPPLLEANVSADAVTPPGPNRWESVEPTQASRGEKRTGSCVRAADNQRILVRHLSAPAAAANADRGAR